MKGMFIRHQHSILSAKAHILYPKSVPKRPVKFAPKCREKSAKTTAKLCCFVGCARAATAGAQTSSRPRVTIINFWRGVGRRSVNPSWRRLIQAVMPRCWPPPFPDRTDVQISRQVPALAAILSWRRRQRQAEYLIYFMYGGEGNVDVFFFVFFCVDVHIFVYNI